MTRLAPLLVVSLLGMPLCGQDPVKLADAVKTLFETQCARCHDGGPGRRSLGGFGTVLDLSDVVSRYVTAGNVDDSQLWDILTDREFPMPPEKALPGGLSVNELALLRWWIEAGAPTKTSPPKPDPETGEIAAPPPVEEKAAPSDLLAKTHFILVHFPVALLLLAAGFELLFLLGWKRAPWSVIRWGCLLGTLGALASFGTGWLLGESQPPERVQLHRWSALAVLALGLAASFCARSAEEPTGKRRLAARLFLWAAAGLVAWTGHLGGTLVHGELF